MNTPFVVKVKLMPPTVLEMRRTGSAAPHNNWSPTVNAAKYSGPIANLRKRPTGTLDVACYFSWG